MEHNSIHMMTISNKKLQNISDYVIKCHSHMLIMCTNELC